ncbi:MAG: hypothetical protein KKD38_09100 [Candidatus Delongbacteria bacterium]|nr:hypothetical protein [Candidatus Delongbacteria bacterium]MCG2761152.1 hypothetical protein [Candidatus Delongbacteria bacterium]
MENKNAVQENLEYIKQVILDSKNMIREKGDIAILWGIVIIIAQLSSFFLIRAKEYSYIGWMWIIVIASGWIITIILAKKKDRRGVSTSANKIDSATWVSTGITMTVVGFAGSFSGMISGYSINGLMAMFLGNAFFITGMIYNAKMFKTAAVGWWIGGTILFWIKNEYTFIVFAIMMLLFQTIPGIMLYIKYKKEEAK